jgi:hypothetical protein
MSKLAAMKYFFFACLVILICRLLASAVFCTFDDAFISFRYAQNLVAGNGFVYNPHEHVLGTTAPLFAMVGSVPLLLSISVPKFFVLFNILCDLGSLWLVYRYIFERNKTLLIFFTLLFALDPVTNRIAVGGMEANMFLFCSLVGLVLYVHGKRVAAFMILSLIYFLRPEALLLYLILAAYDWKVTGKFPGKYIVYCSLVMAPLLFMIWSYYGHVIPQSVLAKSGALNSPFHSLIKNIFFPQAFNYILFPLAVYGLLKKAGGHFYFKLIAIWLVTYAAVFCIAGVWILNWYIYAVEVSQIIFAALALQQISSMMNRDPVRYVCFRLSPLFVVLVWVIVFYRTGRNGVEVHVYDALKKDFSSHAYRDKVFFADDIGALGYYSGGYVYDNLMLVTPETISYKDPSEKILRVHPDYLYLYTDARCLRMVLEDTAIAARYHFIKRYGRNGEAGLPDKAAGWSHDYRQDYMLWQRNGE